MIGSTTQSSALTGVTRTNVFAVNDEEDSSGAPLRPQPFSTASEAGDEGSMFDYSSMGPDDGRNQERGVAHYASEDRRLTSKKEIAGWYSYSWASEV